MEFILYHLKSEIEFAREKLIYLITFNPLTSPKVIELSQKLDKLLIEYETALIAYKKAS